MRTLGKEFASLGAFDVYGFVSHAGYAIAECLDAAGVDGHIDPISARHAAAGGMPATALSDA